MSNTEQLAAGIKKILESYMTDVGDDETPATQAEIEFGDEIRKILQDLIDTEDNLDEKFTSNRNLGSHFLKHCIGPKHKKSSEKYVRYDFETKEQYEEYERKLAVEVNDALENSDCAISDLTDAEDLLKKFDRFFKGNFVIIFLQSCGIKNLKTGRSCTLSLRSYCNDYTTNIPNCKTVDFRVGSDRNKTVTLYPIDADSTESKINSAIKKYCEKEYKIKLVQEDE